MQKDGISILKDLIRIDTVNPPGNEKNAAVYLAELLEPYGFRCQVQDLGDNRANLIAEIGGTEGPELQLNGHLDVVPVTGEWETDPFAAVVDGDRIYGRGSADMKGGIAAMCEAAIRIALEGGPGKGRLKLLFVADEECSNLGTRYYLEHCKEGDYAIIGEPTDLRIAVAHRGVSRDCIDLIGTERHAALPEEEEDALSLAARSILAFRNLNGRLKERTHKILPAPSVAVTMVQGYEKDNVVPERVRLLLDFRILPGMTHEEVDRILDETLKDESIPNYEKRLHFYMPGGEIAADDPFVMQCLEVRKQILGGDTKENVPFAFEATCIQCFLEQSGIRTIICGPGSIHQAHTAGEYTSEEQVRKAADLYEAIVKEILK